jgi:hypothetical protein
MHRLLPLLGAFLLLAAHASLRAQDKIDPDIITKKKTADLLEKAKDEYRLFFKKPQTAIEFWSAIKFEMDLGKFDLAALHLKQLLELPPKDVDPDLVRIEAADGMSAFLRLRQVRPELWSDHPPFRKEAVDNVEKLLDRVTEAVHKHLSDPVRIRKFIAQLDAPTPEERGFAYNQLARSREMAVPYLIDALRTDFGKPVFAKVRETLKRIGPETVPVYLEVLKAVDKDGKGDKGDKDYRDIELRGTLLDIVKERDDKRAIPYLWHMYASKKYPDVIRKKAKETLASLLRIEVSEVPPAKETLAYMAERYYQHKVKFPENKDVLIWEWDGDKLNLTPDKLTPYNAEKFFGERYAREALDLDPSFQPAQVVLLNFMLERYYRPQVDQFFLKSMPPKMQQLLTTIDADLVMRVAERAMDDNQIPVILPLVYTLGKRGEPRAARINDSGNPRALARALYYPDRRVQFAALMGMLDMPEGSLTPVTSERLVDLSRRFLAAGTQPKALVVQAPEDQEKAARDTLKELGFEAVMAKNATDGVNKGRKSADFDLIVLHRGIADRDLSAAYAKIHREYDLATLPIIILVDKAREATVKKLVAKEPNVLVLPEQRFKADDDMKARLDELYKNAHIVKLRPEERTLFGNLSLDILYRMARGDLKGHNVLPALDVIIDQLNVPERAGPAIEIIGRLPGKENQYRLAGLVTDPAYEKLRQFIVIELNRHLRANGVQLDKKQLAELREAQKQAPEGSPVRNELNVTMSIIDRPSAAQSGTDLYRFKSGAPAKENEEKKDKN